ncbi:BatA domain-containing protein [Galbibacter sp. EGI 63066]|uniref:BatA domain-containing protein n=1 Tax=Galbibacter sp. EGI 63066 TaxID=2993559 RepID=UPI002248CE52|nr:BatA domain-containing protein [Galbibacter sp. EGI 63066]MCX2681704.1 BatA domain-containing protein [Galbibacter sp. EGI 63066]
MQFKHPEILWALFLLAIPLIVHLFQLRKYQKEAFTNVRFLKELSIKTRKSSQLKKWLVLLMRMLAYASIIIAFAQPYSANRDIRQTEKETVIYLDNSFSMQLKGNQGELLRRAINQMIENIPETDVFSFFTNEKTYKNIRINDIKNELLGLEYSTKQLSLKEVFLKGEQLFSDADALENFIFISDFQQRNAEDIPQRETAPVFVQLRPTSTSNISVDSVFIAEKSADTYEIEVLTSKNDATENVPMALYNGDQLIAKTSVTFNENQGSATFSVPATEAVKGRVVIEDNGLQYDNEFFFSINKQEKVNVLSINDADDNFLKKIYTEDEFNYSSSPSNAIDYNSISDQNLIVLNELKSIPNALITTLKSAVSEGISICIVTSKENNLNTYNQLLTNLSNLTFTSANETEKQVTGIAFNHPLFNKVFESEVSNFQYPKTQFSYSFSGQTNHVISYADNSPFLVEKNNVYIFSSPLNKSVSNFQNSPLIVPVFYNMAKQSLALPSPYFTIGKENIFDVKTTLGNDEIINIRNAEASFIPLQQNYGKHVRVTTSEAPDKAGIYTIDNGGQALKDLSYNYNRNESLLNYLDLSAVSSEKTFNSTFEALKNIKSENNVNELWKWFAIFALVFLCIELLILKYFK